MRIDLIWNKITLIAFNANLKVPILNGLNWNGPSKSCGWVVDITLRRQEDSIQSARYIASWRPPIHLSTFPNESSVLQLLKRWSSRVLSTWTSSSKFNGYIFYHYKTAANPAFWKLNFYLTLHFEEMNAFGRKGESYWNLVSVPKTIVKITEPYA